MQLPLAVHLSDGVLAWPWLALGLVAAGGLLAWALRGIRDDEIPRVGVLTAAFFISSLIRVPLGPTSAHLILNGLVGLLLGRRAPLALGVGLLLQAVLLGHGGFLVIGINLVIVSIPALLAQALYRALHGGMAASIIFWREGWLAVMWVLHPLFGLACSVVALILILQRRRLPIGAGEFWAGATVGGTAVMFTALLNATLLVVAGTNDWRAVAVFVVVAHVPIAIAEAAIVGGIVSFLRRVKPEMLPGEREA